MKRHDRFAILAFKRLETHTARMRSKATAPSATCTGSYFDVSGMTAEIQPVGT